MRTARFMVLAVGLGACSDDDSNPGADAADSAGDSSGDTTPDSAGDSSADATPDSGGGGGDVMLNGDPILARASLGTATCSVARDVARVDEGFEVSFQFESMLTVGGGAYATRAGKILSLVKLARDGSAAAEVTLDPAEYSSGQAAAASDGSSIAVVWQKVDQATNQGGLFFAKLAAGDLVFEVPVKDLELGRAGYLQAQSALVADGAGGWALVFNEDKNLKFVKLAADGTPGTPGTVVAGDESWVGFAHNVIKTAAGQYAITWSQGAYDASEVYFARLDAAGAKLSGPHRISRAGGDGYSSGGGHRTSGGALREVGDKIWAVFAETYATGEPWVDQTASVIARLAVIDGDGNGEAHALQAPAEDKTIENPTLVPYGDGVAVMWSYGTIIYICGGCIADYDIHLALIDPATLRPMGAEAIAVSGNNGYRNPRAAVLGDELLVTTQIDFHALWYPATAVFACGGE